MANTGPVNGRRKGWIRQVWESNGVGGRAVLAVFLLGFGLMPVLLVAVIILPPSVFRPGGWHQAGVASAIAGFSITSIYSSISDAMMTARYLRGLVETAKYLTSLQREFLLEWARTKELLGVNGQFRGSVAIGLIYAILYFGFFYGAMPYTMLVHPYLGDMTAPSFAAFVIPTFVIAYVYSFRRFRRIEREATAKGLRVVELRRQMRPRLRRAKPGNSG